MSEIIYSYTYWPYLFYIHMRVYLKDISSLVLYEYYLLCVWLESLFEFFLVFFFYFLNQRFARRYKIIAITLI